MLKYCIKCGDIVGKFNLTKEGLICDYCMGIKIKPKNYYIISPEKDTNSVIFKWTR